MDDLINDWVFDYTEYRQRRRFGESWLSAAFAASGWVILLPLTGTLACGILYLMKLLW